MYNIHYGGTVSSESLLAATENIASATEIDMEKNCPGAKTSDRS
jgi:hypothetical protein